MKKLKKKSFHLHFSGAWFCSCPLEKATKSTHVYDLPSQCIIATKREQVHNRSCYSQGIIRNSTPLPMDTTPVGFFSINHPLIMRAVIIRQNSHWEKFSPRGWKRQPEIWPSFLALELIFQHLVLLIQMARMTIKLTTTASTTAGITLRVVGDGCGELKSWGSRINELKFTLIWNNKPAIYHQWVGQLYAEYGRKLFILRQKGCSGEKWDSFFPEVKPFQFLCWDQVEFRLTSSEMSLCLL